MIIQYFQVTAANLYTPCKFCARFYAHKAQCHCSLCKGNVIDHAHRIATSSSLHLPPLVWKIYSLNLLVCVARRNHSFLTWALATIVANSSVRAKGRTAAVPTSRLLSAVRTHHAIFLGNTAVRFILLLLPHVRTSRHFWELRRIWEGFLRWRLFPLCNFRFFSWLRCDFDPTFFDPTAILRCDRSMWIWT